MPGIRHSLERVDSAVLELETRAHDEILDGGGDEYLAGFRQAPTRAPIATARPAMSSPLDSISPVWSPARISTPFRLID